MIRSIKKYLICCIMKVNFFITCLAIFLTSSCSSEYCVDNYNTKLYFNTPAKVWEEAIPIGNGRLGGMVYGGVHEELIQTNDDTFWSGEPRNVQNPSASAYIPEIRKLIFEGKNIEAQKLIDSKILGPNNECYMPLADIILKMPQGDYSDYKRVLDMNKGIVSISYKQNGVSYHRDIFSSYPDQAIVMKISSDKKGALDTDIMLDSQIKHNILSLGNNGLSIRGTAPIHTEPHYQGKHEPIYKEGHGMRFEGRIMVKKTDGKIIQKNDKIELRDATYAELVYVAATSFNGFENNPNTNGIDEVKACDNYISNINDYDYIELKKRHVKDFESLFSRVSIDLGSSSCDTLSLDRRIKSYKPGTDPSLTALYFQFGRYLLISSSRPGTQPANLQGIWNKDMQPAWSSNWTLNCNAQINYWPAEVTNLSECHLPLFDLIRESSVDGARTAKNLYNSRGWILHHNVDIWRTTWPVGGSGLWAMYQVGGAWLCQHIWEHYLFTQDVDFLRENYPLLKGAVRFYLDNLQKDKDGYWVTNPSESFENTYIKPNGEIGWACMGAAQDMQIIRSLFRNTMSAIDILCSDKEFRSEIKLKYDSLAPMKISPTTGRLQEWNDDWKASNPRSGQVAQGWGFVASDLITLRGTPELAHAFRKTLEHRKPGLSYNSGSWTGAFPASFWARMAEGDSAQVVIDRHFEKALNPNFTCYFMGFWEIDGNLGITSSISEMLLQSHSGEIDLLPALPSKYPTGFVKGLRARGGYEVDIYWSNGLLDKAIIRADRVNGLQKVNIRYRNIVKKVEISKGGKYVFK